MMYKREKTKVKEWKVRLSLISTFEGEDEEVDVAELVVEKDRRIDAEAYFGYCAGILKGVIFDEDEDQEIIEEDLDDEELEDDEEIGT